MDSPLIIDIEERLAFVTLNRPEKRNALNPVLITELTRVFIDLQADKDVKIIVLKASGTAFSAGADLDHLKQLVQNSREDNFADSRRLRDLYLAIYYNTKPVIAQVEGHAIAGGCGLLAVCDFVFAVPEAKFACTEVKIGFVPALISCFLNLRIGESRTKELLLSGDLIDAETAMRYNLVNFITTKDSIEQRVTEYAMKLCITTSAESVSSTKQLLKEFGKDALAKNLELAVQANAESRFTDDFKRGVQAFLNKEKLDW